MSQLSFSVVRGNRTADILMKNLHMKDSEVGGNLRNFHVLTTLPQSKEEIKIKMFTSHWEWRGQLNPQFEDEEWCSSMENSTHTHTPSPNFLIDGKLYTSPPPLTFSWYLLPRFLHKKFISPLSSLE